MSLGAWQLAVCGISHKVAALDELERLTVSGDRLAHANALVARLPQVAESLILSTCNRIEFYLVLPRGHDPREVVAAFYDVFTDAAAAARQAPWQVRTGTDVARHLFRVAASLDSMVVGENQILGQIKNAYSAACGVKATGKVTHRLFHQSFRAGKQVRSDTAMGRGACSVSSAAVELLAEPLRKLTGPDILFIGVNRVIELAADRLRHTPGAHLRFANRTPRKAEALAARYEASACGLDQLVAQLASAHVVVSCTSSPRPVITRAMLADAATERTRGTGIIMDLALPRDVESGDDGPQPFVIYTLDDVGRFVEARQRERKGEVPQAEQIVMHRACEFNYWYEQVMQEPMYNGHAPAFESLRREELAGILDALPPHLQRELHAATRRLVQRVTAAAERGRVSSAED